MKEVRKKSSDPAVNQMLIKAYRQQIDLVWDRTEAMQPQCGFGRLAICCTDCYEGPCRVNPFATTEQLTACGRDRNALAANHTMRKTEDGLNALVKLACQFGADLDKTVLQSVCATADAMLAPANLEQRLEEIGGTVAVVLEAIGQAKEKKYGSAEADVTSVGFGVLKADRANVVLHGHVAPEVAGWLNAAAAHGSEPVNLVTICGNEVSGPLNIPVLTNYDSQETPLLSGAVDLLVVGSQCVMPAVIALAGKMAIPVIYASAIKDKAGAGQAVELAIAALRQRAAKNVSIPAVAEEVYAGYTANNSPELFKALGQAYMQGKAAGLVYFGGCGNISNTQDAGLVNLAAQLVSNGYIIAAAGCAGTALAKAGMCKPDYACGDLRNILPLGTPPVLYLGSCHDAGLFLAMAKAVGASGMPVLAVMPEVTHNKTLATAVGFASRGITTFVGLEVLKSMPGMNLNGKLLPLADFSQLPEALPEVAAAK